MKIAFPIDKPFLMASGQPGPHVVITAGVHGDEYEPMLAAMQLIEQLQQNIIAGSVSIIPVVNPTAFSAGTRTGDDGLDLARICPGNSNGSSSHQAAAKLSALIQTADYYIDLHTGGREFDIYPLAGYMLHASAEILARQQWMAKAFNLPVVWGTDSALEGRTLSVARDVNVPAIYVEYGGGEPFKKQVVQSYAQGCLNVLAGLQMIRVENEITPQLQYWVEDYTPNNGHLQSKMLAPEEGVFIPAIALGDAIQKGQEWGRIVNLRNNSEVTVTADSEGIVLFLRATSFVRIGNSLGGVLPISKPGKKLIP